MLHRFALTTLLLIAAIPAAAEEARTRLVVGGLNLKGTDMRIELTGDHGGFSAGAVSGDVNAESGRMALGGYAAYAFDDVHLSSSLRGDQDRTVADFSAAYAGFGPDSVAAFRLGYEMGRAQAFSINPAQAGLNVFGGDYDPSGSMADLSLTLSFTHDVTPSLSLGGFAAASRQDGEHSAPEKDLRFGAGLGYKF